jgi:chemotaxis protein CheD
MAFNKTADKSKTIIGIGEMAIKSCFSEHISHPLITFALGSCLGITIYDQKLKIGAMAHFMLPDSKLEPQKAITAPYKYVDSGMMRLLFEFIKRGSNKNNLVIKAAGCSNTLDPANHFAIGERNYNTLLEFLNDNKLFLSARHIGGRLTRTMFLDLSTGATTLKINNQIINLNKSVHLPWISK